MIIRKISNALSFLYFYILTLKNKGRVKLDGRVIVKGLPIIELSKTAKLKIGKKTTLNSSNHKYHINMFAPVKLVADGDNSSIVIGDNTRVHGSCIHAREYIEIGNRCLIAANSNIIDNNGHNLSFDNPKNRINTSGKSDKVIIADDVWIGTGCLILPGTKIGRGAIVSAFSVVNGVFPEKCLIAGNPAKIVKQY